MNKICTSIEQSKKLIELGIDVNTADMFWDTAEPDKRRKPLVGPISDYYDMGNWAVPAWSLTALLKFIPKHPKHIKNVNVLRIDNDEKDFSIWYDEIGCGVNTELPDITMEDPVDACVEMILKLHELNLL